MGLETLEKKKVGGAISDALRRALGMHVACRGTRSDQSRCDADNGSFTRIPMQWNAAAGGFW
jgi:hypothetical protein